MRKKWLLTSIAFYSLNWTFMAFFAGNRNDIDLIGAFTFLIMLSMLLASSIIYHPRYRIFFQRFIILQNVDWYLKVSVFALTIIFINLEWNIIIAFVFSLVSFLLEFAVKIFLLNEFKKIPLHEIENHDGKYIVHLESVSKSGVPTALLYICVIVILSIVLFYKNDLALGIMYVLFCLINIYSSDNETRSKRSIGFQNLSFLIGIFSAQFIIKLNIDYNFADEGLIYLLAFFVINVSLTPLNKELRSYFKMKNK